jgi:hypothetical protein
MGEKYVNEQQTQAGTLQRLDFFQSMSNHIELFTKNPPQSLKDPSLSFANDLQTSSWVMSQPQTFLSHFLPLIVTIL